MRWPEIFYKAKKRRQEPAPAFRSSISATPKSIAAETLTLATKPAPAPPDEVSPSQAVTVESKPTKPSLDQPILPGNSPLSPPTKPAESSIPSSTNPTLPSHETALQGNKPTPADESLRGKAKMTDSAPIVPAPQPDQPKVASEPPSAVSPPAFPVAVPVGGVTQTELPTKSPSEKPSSPFEAKVAESSGKVEESAKNSSDTKASTERTATTSSKTEPTPTSIPLDHLPAQSPEKKEFLLVNGERILGRILSETPENIYLEHGTLGVLTLPRLQIATHPVEIILINGDRIVGDIMAETPETLYVRHASLGMLTVPRSQRSTRVVEVLLKDGDRILGEVLAETETMTVIRSSTLGTISVPHNKVSMLNRKIEQMSLKALPKAGPTLQDKASK